MHFASAAAKRLNHSPAAEQVDLHNALGGIQVEGSGWALEAVATPGHTSNHISVVVEDGDVSVLLAGDTSYNEALMLAGKIDGVSPNAAVTAQTLATIRQFASERPTVYLPAHDPDGATRFARRQTVPVAMSRAA